MNAILTLRNFAKLAALLLFAILFIGVLAVNPGKGQGDWILNRANGHYYKILDSWNTWTNCQSAAAAEGAHLVTITNQAEQVWLIE